MEEDGIARGEEVRQMASEREKELKARVRARMRALCVRARYIRANSKTRAYGLLCSHSMSGAQSVNRFALNALRL